MQALDCKELKIVLAETTDLYLWNEVEMEQAIPSSDSVSCLVAQRKDVWR